MSVYFNVYTVDAVHKDYVRSCMSKFLCHLSPGPGPGRYRLPPTIGFIGHDFTKPACPAYSFHGRINNSSKLHHDNVFFTWMGKHKEVDCSLR